MLDNIFQYLNLWIRKKFKETFTTDGSGNTAIRVAGEITTTESTNSKHKVVSITINENTWTLLTTGISNQRTISIINKTGFQIVINSDTNVTSYFGTPIEDDDERYYDLTQTGDQLYAKVEAGGGTVNLIVEAIGKA
jgi:hypothetical protein